MGQSPRPMPRWLLVAVLCPLAASAAPEEIDPTPRYFDVVQRYADGERAEAVAGLGEWTEPELKRVVDWLVAWARWAEECGTCPLKLKFEQLPLPAAVMLHTDRDALLRQRLPLADEGPPLCRTTFHAAVAERLVTLLFGKPGTTAFARRWYLAMTLRSHGESCFEDAARWARAGLKWFPRDGELLLASGTTQEVVGSYAVGFPETQRRQALDQARRSFQQALEADSELPEAGLHAGRVLWRLHQFEAASAHFEAVLARSQDPSLLYLAHLFLGQIHEEAGRWGEAEREYRAALLLDPPVQTAAVALSHVLLLSGEAAAAREVLDRALAQAGRRRRPDAYWEYFRGRSASAEEMLEELREAHP